MKGFLRFTQILLAAAIIGINVFQLIYKSTTFPSNTITATLFVILFAIILINKYLYKSKSNNKRKFVIKTNTKFNSQSKNNNKNVENTNQKGHKRDKLHKNKK